MEGKIQVVSTVPVMTKEDLSLAYTPGVAQPCLEIKKISIKATNLPAGGTCASWLPTEQYWDWVYRSEAAMPVMEGKCVLFKSFGDVDAFPLCIKSKDVDEIVNTIYLIREFGGINLEDISRRDV